MTLTESFVMLLMSVIIFFYLSYSFFLVLFFVEIVSHSPITLEYLIREGFLLKLWPLILLAFIVNHYCPKCCAISLSLPFTESNSSFAGLILFNMQ